MITSTSNQQMKNLTLLMKKAKARNEQGVFVAEGRKMFLEAPVEWVKQVYVSESFYGTCTQGNMQDCMESCTPKHGEEKLNRKVLERLNETGYEIVSDNLFKSVSDTQTPQGILCVIKKPEYALEKLIKGEQTHLLILESIQDPGNLGTMVRTGEGAGITGVIMNQTTVDLFNPKTVPRWEAFIVFLFSSRKILRGRFHHSKSSRSMSMRRTLRAHFPMMSRTIRKRRRFSSEMRETDCRMRSQIWQILILRFQCRDRWNP